MFFERSRSTVLELSEAPLLEILLVATEITTTPLDLAAKRKPGQRLRKTEMANPLQEIAGELDTIFMVVVAFLVLTWIVVGLRIYVRALLIKTFGYDDYSILIAQCFFTVTCGCTIFFVKATKDVLNGQSFGLPANFGIVRAAFLLLHIDC